jgi:hypothetical protein
MAAPRFSPERITFGLLLVAVGTVALLANFGRLDFLDTLQAYWPLSLVVWGGLELFAYARDRAPGGRS